MRYLVTGKQMKQVDQYTIQTIGIPSLVLMERAAIAVAREVEQLGKRQTISGQSVELAIMEQMELLLPEYYFSRDILSL